MTDRPPSVPGWRLFIAAPVPAPAADSLWASLAPLRERHPSARWARREQLHATLVFLGQTDPAEVGRLTEAVAEAGPCFAPFEIATAGGGGRVDNRRSGVAWLQIENGGTELRELSLTLDRLIGSNAYAGRPPRPHITVARRIDDSLLADLRALAPTVRVSWLVDRIVLLRSHPDPGGSRYEALAERLLTGAPVGP